MKSENLYVIRVTEDINSNPEIYKNILFKNKEHAKIIFDKLISTHKRSAWYKSTRTEIMTLEEFIRELHEMIDDCVYQE